MVTILGTSYGIALAVYFVGLVVVGFRTRRRIGVRFFGSLVDYVGLKAALEAMALLAAWPLTRRRRTAWLEQHATATDGDCG